MANGWRPGLPRPCGGGDAVEARSLVLYPSDEESIWVPDIVTHFDPNCGSHHPWRNFSNLEEFKQDVRNLEADGSNRFFVHLFRPQSWQLGDQPLRSIASFTSRLSKKWNLMAHTHVE